MKLHTIDDSVYHIRWLCGSLYKNDNWGKLNGSVNINHPQIVYLLESKQNQTPHNLGTVGSSKSVDRPSPSPNPMCRLTLFCFSMDVPLKLMASCQWLTVVIELKGCEITRTVLYLYIYICKYIYMCVCFMVLHPLSLPGGWNYIYIYIYIYIYWRELNRKWWGAIY